MKDCGDYGADLELYLDKELIGPDLEEFRAHLEGCAACRAELEVREELCRLLHRSRPLYSAPDALRDRVMRTTELSPFSMPYTPPGLGGRIFEASSAASAIRRAWRSPLADAGSCNSSRCCRTSVNTRHSAAGER